MAWRKAGITPFRGNAIDVYRYYQSRGMVKTGLPRYGAMVFYGTTSSNPYGHATIYVGGTTVVGTQGFDHANLPVALYGIDKSPNRLGWVALG